MGQAKLRGTYEQRKAQAAERARWGYLDKDKTKKRVLGAPAPRQVALAALAATGRRP